MAKVRKIQTGVSLDPQIMDYVDNLGKSDEPLYRRRPRSQIISLIVEEHAKRSGVALIDEQEPAAANA